MSLFMMMAAAQQGQSSEAWTPLDIADLISWHDPTDAATVFEADASGRVSAITDKSGNGWTASQANPSTQPITNSTTVNGLNVFDGTGTYYLDTSSSYNIGTSGDLVMGIFIHNASSIGAGSGALNFKNDVTYYGGITTTNASNWQSQVLSTPSDNVSLAANSTLGNPAQGIITAVWNWSTGEVSLYENGVLVTPPSGSNPATNYTSNKLEQVQTLRLMTRAAGGARSFSGSLGDAIVASDASTDTRQKIEGYLAHKYGTTADLDVSHPYKSVAP